MGINLFSNITCGQNFTLRYLSYEFWSDIGDPRVSQYFLIRVGPLFTLSVITFYLFFSLFLGPKLMSNRPAFKLRRLILCYNIVMVFLNLKFLIFVMGFLNYGLYLFVHESPNREDRSVQALHNLDQAHQIFVTKFVDLFDTVFFILCKKRRHVSLLHLYHHSVVPILCWLSFRLTPDLQPLWIFVLINCTIHVLMYTYYALSSFGPKVRPYLWWKIYITQLQMIQFVIYGVYGVYCFHVIEGIPLSLQVFVHIQSPIFLVLFSHFYIKAYLKNRDINNKCLHRNGLHKGKGIQNGFKCE